MTESRTLSVMVADVVDSTELFDRLGSENADAFRRALFVSFAEAITTNGGTLVKTMGDGCLATFASAAEAVGAAVAVQSSAARLARRAARPSLRVGVAVGDVTVEDGDVFGAAVVVASRLCAIASPDQVLVTDVIRSLAGDRGGHRYERLGDLDLKGIAEPVAANRVLVPPTGGVGLALPATLAGRPGELLVGREADQQRLRDAWTAAAAGERRLVLLAGEPGIGKTRLAADLARHAHRDGALVLFGSCEEDLSVPYQPFAEALHRALEVADRTLLSEHVQTCGGELGRLLPELTRRVPGTPAPVVAEPELERLRMFDAVADLLRRLTADFAVLVVLDDLQWAAPGTVQMLRHLLQVEAPLALLIVGTYRDSEVDRRHPVTALLADVHHRSGMERLALSGLGTTGIEAYLEAVAEERLDDGGRSLAVALRERTAGNPFFAGQILRHLVERGALIHRDGRWTADLVIEELGLPEGVLDVVGRRLSRLSDSATQALSVAAVAGLSCSLADLELAADPAVPIDTLVGALDEAVAARLLTEAEPGRYSFIHAIVRDALLGELSAARRATIHRRLASALVRRYGEGPGPHAAALAHHAIEAAVLGDTQAAARAALSAATYAGNQADFENALAVLERASAVLDAGDLPDHRARFDVALALADVHGFRFRPSDDSRAANRHSVQRAAAAARALASPERLGRAALAMAVGRFGDDDRELLDLADEALEALDPAHDALYAAVLVFGGWARLLQNKPEGMAMVERAVRLADERADEAPELCARVWDMAAFSLLGTPGAAWRLRLAEASDAAIERARSGSLGTYTADPYRGILDTPGHRGASRLALADREGFEAELEGWASTATTTGYPAVFAYTLFWRALLAMLDGRFTDATQLATVVVETVPSHANFELGHEAQLLWLAIEQGELSGLAPALERLAGDAAGVPAFRAALTKSLVAASRPDDARQELHSMLEQWSAYARNWTWPIVPFFLAEVAAELPAANAAGALLTELDPYAGELLVVGPGLIVAGAYDRARGLLRTLVGRYAEAVACLEAAIALEERVKSPPLVARSRYWLARALLERGMPGDRERARAELDRSLAVAERLGMRTLAADGRLLLRVRLDGSTRWAASESNRGPAD